MLQGFFKLSALDRDDNTVALAGLFFLACLTMTSLAFTQRKRLSHGESTSLPRPATTLPVIGNLLDGIKNAPRYHDWLLDQFRAFGGKPWLMQIPGRPNIIMIATPELVEDVEKTHFTKFGKGPYQTDLFADFLGNYIAAVDKERWKFQRKTLTHLFTHRALRDYMTEMIHKHTITLDNVLTEAAKTQTPLDIHSVFSQFTMEVFVEFGYGLELQSFGTGKAHPFQKAYDAAQFVIFTRFQRPTWVWKIQRWLNLGTEADLKRSMTLINETSRNIISGMMERRAQQQDTQSDRKTLLSVFLDSKMDNNDMLTPELMRDIVIGSIIAGRDTTAQAMSWFVYCLSNHPEVEKRLRQEIAAVIPEANASSSASSLMLTMDMVQDLHYMEAALKETLRLYPVVPLNLQFAYEDVVLSDGTFIPAGTFVGLATYAQGHLTNVWGADAEEFKPERWLDPATGKLHSDHSHFKYNVFHGGPRRCLGINLAMLEMKAVLVKILTKYHLESVPGQSVTYEQSAMLPIKGSFMIRVKPLGQSVSSE